MQLKILYISNEAALGGAAQSLLNMIQAVKNRNITAVVVIPEKGSIENRLMDLGITYYVVPFSNGYGLIGTDSCVKQGQNFVDNYYAALQLQDIIQRENISLIHINSSVSNVGAFAALMSGIPYIWHFREVLSDHYDSEFWDRELKINLIHHSDAAIAISDVVIKKYKERYNVNSACIYNGIDIDSYKNELNEANYSSGLQRFVITGAITQGKGQFDAVRAVEVLIEEGISNIHLDLVGYGGGRFCWFLEQYIHNKKLEKYISIHPFQHDLSEYRKQSQYALTTSKMEALGRSTIEAMLAGQIVIGADTGGTKEIIGVDESRGYLYRQGDYHSLAMAMKRALSEADEKKELMRNNAQCYAEETFSLEKYADCICTLYEKVLEDYSAKDKYPLQVFLKELEERYRALSNNAEIKVSSVNNYKCILDKWKQVETIGRSISDYLKECNWKSVAIYGMGKLGCRLYEELNASEIEIPYVIDQNPEFLEELVRVKMPNEIPDEVDVIIVTVSKEEQEIVRSYKERYNCNIVGISQLLEGAIGKNIKV